MANLQNVRAATADDIAAMLALERQVEGATHWSEAEYRRIFDAHPPTRTALVISEGRLIGFIVARDARGEWEIENLVVAEDHRRRGLATILVRELVKQAQAKAVASLLLEVRESNAPARALYEKCGFVEVGWRSNYYSDPPEDAILYSFSFSQTL